VLRLAGRFEGGQVDIRQKVARLVSSSISNREGDDPAEQFRRLRSEVVDLGVGGFTIFGGNVDSTAELVAELQEASPHCLLVSSDLERGLGQQLEGGTILPSHMAVGATGIPDLAFAQGWVTAVEARAVGINLVFAPVADVLTEPTNPIIGARSFGGDPDNVAAFTAAFVRGCQLGGAAATAKHFPGHGATVVDSHIALPVVNADGGLLSDRELVPFRAAIREGAQAVMTAHVAYPALTGTGDPATLSPCIIRGMLRAGLGFDGVIVTDALLMGGITEGSTCGEAAVRAIEAGVDVLLMPENVHEAIGCVTAAVECGRVGEDRIDRSLARLDALLSWIESRPDPGVLEKEIDPEVASGFESSASLEENRRVWKNPRHDAVAIGVARRSITLLKDDKGYVTCDPSRYTAEGAGFYAIMDAERPVNLVWLRSELCANLPGATITVADSTMGDPEFSRIVEEASGKECAIVSIFDDVAAWRGRAGPDGRLASMLRRLTAACEKTIVIAFAAPQIVTLIADAPAVLCCYDGSPAAQVAAIEAILGECPLTGRLPVAVPPLYEIGHGLPRG
jgi:beta-N-acetylhexosaminidase